MNTRLRTKLALCFILLMPLSMVVTVGVGGCSVFQGAPIASDADPVVVHAERTANFALDTFDSFLLWEYQNRAVLRDDNIKKAADQIRQNGKQWITDLRDTTKTYKTVRSKENADKLDYALAVVNKSLEIARRYLLIKTATQPQG